jgi:hypothetical protein
VIGAELRQEPLDGMREMEYAADGPTRRPAQRLECLYVNAAKGIKSTKLESSFTVAGTIWYQLGRSAGSPESHLELSMFAEPNVFTSNRLSLPVHWFSGKPAYLAR